MDPNLTPPAPTILITGEAIAFGMRVDPAGNPCGMLSVVSGGGFVRTDLAIPADHIGKLIDALEQIRKDLPGTGIVPASAADLGRIRGRN